MTRRIELAHNVVIHHGNCLDDLALGKIPRTYLITDPPYGVNNRCDYAAELSKGNHTGKRNKFKNIEGDKRNLASSFRPTPWLRYGFQKVVMWGGNYYSDKLPLGSWLIWCKKRDTQLGKFMGDCEMAWMSGGKSSYLFHYVWNGHDREGQRGPTLHPTEKPVALMKWCIQKTKAPIGSIIVDPYMGAGATAVAAIEMGMGFIGYEVEGDYFKTAIQRIETALDNPLNFEVSASESLRRKIIKR